jgi:hypothetical protein
MIAWDTIRPAIRTQIASVVGINEKLVSWQDRKKYYNPAASIQLKITAVHSRGRDEERYTDTAEGFKRYLVGWRYFTLSIAVESLSQEDDEIALNYTELIRTRFRRRSIKEALEAVDVVILDDLSTVEIPLKDGDRVWSKNAFDFLMCASFTDEDTDYDGSWIESVGISGLGEETVVAMRSFNAGFSSGFQRSK